MANLFELPNLSEGYDDILVDLSTEIVVFPIMVLVFTFFFIFFGGGFVQLNRQGYLDAPMWSTLSFLTTSLVALLMTLATGIVNPVVLGVVFGGTIFSALWLFLSKGRFEN